MCRTVGVAAAATVDDVDVAPLPLLLAMTNIYVNDTAHDNVKYSTYIGKLYNIVPMPPCRVVSQ